MSSAGSAGIEWQREDPNLLAMADQRSAALDMRPSDVTLTGEGFLIVTRPLVE
jgi:1,6-anhydro-N-acetylmuramate kinase